MEPQIFIEFINLVAGFRIKLKEIHWLNTNKAVHENTEQLTYELDSFADSFMEEFLAIQGRESLNPGDYMATVMLDSEYDELMNNIIGAFSEFRTRVTDPVYAGMLSQIDNMISSININYYRKGLS